MHTRPLTALAALAMLIAAPAAMAQGAAAPPAAVTYKAEFLRALDQTEDRYVSLAEAIPADRYGWRPGEGVRSVGELFLHVAAANFGLTNMIGSPPPAGFSGQGYESSTTDKAKIVDELKRSFAHLRQSVERLSEADADKASRWFSGPTTYRGVLLNLHGHLGEHLGQAIAYARVNGVVPPWTAARQ